MQLFHEIYGIYFKLVSEIIEEAIQRQAQNGSGVSYNRARQIMQDAGIYNACITNILDALFDNSKKMEVDRWNLIDSEGKTHIKNKPSRPITTLEKRWLKTLLADPKIQLFSVSSQGLEDVEPLWSQDVIRTFDTAADADPYDQEAYRKRFQMILQAVREKTWLDLSSEDENIKVHFFPQKLEYSAKDDKFRVEGIADNHLEMFEIAQIKNCHISSDQSGECDFSEFQKTNTKTLVLEIYDNYNTLSRLLIELSNYEKTDVRQIAGSTYSLELKYREGDAGELRTRLLGFGPHVKVLEPEEFIAEMRQRVTKQKIPEL
ncbi:MAG: WYL domain-containing protein [Proteobacteria bacterium]|nr:WYL domain-containing protein [Pseudomonadota bacterium]